MPYVIHVWPLSSHKVLVSFLLMKMETSQISWSRSQSCGVEICSQAVGMAASHAKWPIHRGGHPWNAWQTLRGYLIIILFSTTSTKMIHGYESTPNLEFMGIFFLLARLIKMRWSEYAECVGGKTWESRNLGITPITMSTLQPDLFCGFRQTKVNPSECSQMPS